jgi:hypothetical protein
LTPWSYFEQGSRSPLFGGKVIHPNQALWQGHEKRRHLVAAKLLFHQYLAMLVDSVDLEHVLCQVDANSGKLHDGRPFSVQVVDQHLHFGTLMPLRVGRSSHCLRRPEPLGL